MQTLFKYYWDSMLFFVIAMVTGAWVGGMEGAALSAMWSILILTVLESAVSADNAVVNAQILTHWNKKWRRIFIWFGIPIAVFAVRGILPLEIVSVVGNMSLAESWNMALNDRVGFQKIIESSHNVIMGFGGTFLLLVFLNYMTDKEKDDNWLTIERLFKSGNFYTWSFGLLGIALLFAHYVLSASEFNSFALSIGVGVATYYGIKLLKVLTGTGKTYVEQGIVGFLYLEVLDASFSLDGVIAGFAITNNLLVLMLGLGAGAFLVRSMTLHMLDKGVLNMYRYLDNGAFWSIGALAAMMLISIKVHLPEVAIGGISLGFLVLAVYASIKANDDDADAGKATPATVTP